jgi:hypothetical protein
MNALQAYLLWPAECGWRQIWVYHHHCCNSTVAHDRLFGSSNIVQLATFESATSRSAAAAAAYISWALKVSWA